MTTNLKFIKLNKVKQISIIQFYRPKKHNSLTDKLLKELQELLNFLKNDKQTRLIILTGYGKKAFSSGVDLGFLTNLKTAEENREFALILEKTAMQIFKYPKPIIAAINGYALGGGFGLAAACDIRIASENAKIGFPAVKIAATMPITCTSFVYSLIGFAKTKYLMLTGEILNAKEALQIGLVDNVYQNNLIEAAITLGEKILEGTDLALQMTKQSINTLISKDLESLQLFAADNFAYLSQTKDWKERMLNFLKQKK